jgi:hypothetical protein
VGEAVHLLVSLYLYFESVWCISQIILGFINQLVILGIICHLFDPKERSWGVMDTQNSK